MVIAKNKVLFNTSGEREFHITASTSLLKIEVKDGTVTVMGKMTPNSDYVLLAGVDNLLKKQSVAGPGITSYEVAGLYKVKLTYSGSEPVISTLIG